MEINQEEYKNYLGEEYLTMHDAADLLDIEETELRELIQKHQIPTRQIAGVFLRIRKEDLEHLKNKWRIERELFPKPQPHFAHDTTVAPPTFKDRFEDFWYFNDFYILCSLLIVVLLYFIIASQ